MEQGKHEPPGGLLRIFLDIWPGFGPPLTHSFYMSKLSYYKTMVKGILLLSLVFSAIPVLKAQTSFGITAGYGKSSLTKIQGSIEPFSRYSSRNSFWGGLNARFALGEHGFFLATSLIYNQRGYDYKLQNTTGANNTLKDSAFLQTLNYTDLNLILLKKFSLDERSGFFVGVGPVVNVFVSGKEKISMNYFGNTIPSSTTTKSNLQTGSAAGNYKRIYPSLSVMAGFEYRRFSVAVHYNMPLDYYYIDAGKKLQHSIRSFGVSAGFTLFTSHKGDPVLRERKVFVPKETREPKVVQPVKIDSTLDTDGDSIPDYKDKCPGHKGTATYEGCPVPDSDGDGVNDDADKCPQVEGPVSNNGCPEFKEPEVPNSPDTIRFTIYFEQAKSELKTTGFKTLDEVVRLMKANPRLVAQFNGHTDAHGSVEANSIRAFSRAAICADYVASFFIERTRLTVAAFSNRKPVADLNDPSVQWKNRRVEILLYQK